MATLATYHRDDLPLCTDYDVVVAGGGPSGCTAAIAAAQEGAKVLLVERTGALGGMSTVGLVPQWAPFSDGRQIIYRSLAEQIFTESKRRMHSLISPSDTDWVAISAEKLKSLFDELMTENSVSVLFFTTAADVVTENGTVRQVILANKAGLTAYTAKVFIDCTGDGDLAAWAGCAFHKGDALGNLQPGSLCFMLSDIDIDAFRRHPCMQACNPDAVIHRIAADPRYPLITDTHMCLVPVGADVLGFNAGHIAFDHTDPVSVSAAMIRGRQIACQLHQALKDYEPDLFGKSELLATASLIGVRESRRIMGDYTLTLDDYKARRVFSDDIGCNCYGIDVHTTERTQSQAISYQKGESHGIPYRCLLPLGIRNMLIAGRCISTDRAVQGSIRVMPVCMVTGEAAGCAAALAVQNSCDPRQISITALQEMLRRRGAYLKNGKDVVYV